MRATPSEGHAMDHIGWRTTTDLDAKAAELKAKDVKLTTEQRPSETSTFPMSNALRGKD
jgi:hypothetical protein